MSTVTRSNPFATVIETRPGEVRVRLGDNTELPRWYPSLLQSTSVGAVGTMLRLNQEDMHFLPQGVSLPSGSGGTAAWGGITGTLSDQGDLNTALNGKASSTHDHSGVYSPVSHNHDATYSPVTHQHTVSQITASNSPTATTFLRGDGSWVVPTNTVYSSMTVAEAEAGTSTTGRVIAAVRLKDAILYHAPVKTADLNAHTGNTSNPHAVTKAQVGLGNADNTSDVNKPVSTATQTAIANFETTTQLNARDTANRARANHTGNQAISTVTNLQEILDGKPIVVDPGNFATAIGVGAQSAGISSFAAGHGASSAGESSVAVGREASASVLQSMAIGRSAAASGTDSIAVGGISVASNSNTVAVGVGSLASGGSATALGRDAKAQANNTLAVGRTANASAIGSVALGMSSTSSSQDATALGTLAQATGISSIAMGARAVASSSNALAVGTDVNAAAVQSIAIGINASADSSSTGSLVTGYNAFTISSTYATVLGTSAKADLSDNSVVGGTSASAISSGNAVVSGSSARATNSSNAYVGGSGAVANASATAIAIGLAVVDGSASAIAIGHDANVLPGSSSSWAFGRGAIVPGSTPNRGVLAANRVDVNRSSGTGTGSTTLGLLSPDGTRAIIQAENDDALSVNGTVLGKVKRHRNGQNISTTITTAGDIDFTTALATVSGLVPGASYVIDVNVYLWMLTPSTGSFRPIIKVPTSSTEMIGSVTAAFGTTHDHSWGNYMTTTANASGQISVHPAARWIAGSITSSRGEIILRVEPA